MYYNYVLDCSTEGVTIWIIIHGVDLHCLTGEGDQFWLEFLKETNLVPRAFTWKMGRRNQALRTSLEAAVNVHDQ